MNRSGLLSVILVGDIFPSVTNWYDAYDIFFNRSLVSTLWQWSVGLYQNRKETAQKETRYTKQYKNNTKTQNTQNREQKYKTKINIKRILKIVSRVIRQQQIEGNSNEVTYCTQPSYSYITLNQFHRRSSLNFSKLPFPSFHITSLHITSHNFTSNNFTPLHITSLHITPHHFT